VTFLLIAVNASMAYELIRWRKKNWIPAVAISAIVTILAVFAQPGSGSPKHEVPVACVQGEGLQYRQYLDLTREAIEHPMKPKFIVLPEHTVSELADDRHPFVKSLSDLADTHDVYICIGAHVEATKSAECYYDNVAMLIGPDGNIIGTQAKAVPVPFFQDGNPAESHMVVNTPHSSAGMYVCYDATFTDVPRRLHKLGAEILLAPLMDPQRWPVQQRWQHADMGSFRSIELRCSQVRAASSGVSQIIDPSGHVRVQRSRQEGPGVICTMVPIGKQSTIFTRGGYLFATAIGVIFLAVIAALTLAEWTSKFIKQT